MNPETFKYKLFGRFKGRKKNTLLSYKKLNKFKINIKKDINKLNYNILDIGSGSGENAIHLANIRPLSKVYTCELFEDGNINLINKIIKNKIENIKLYQGNVIEFLDLIESPMTFNEIWILFPDPWPKKRHHKRRLINEKFLMKIYNNLKADGRIFISSDSSNYLCSILLTIFKVKNHYIWKNESFSKWYYKALLLPETKFYKKAEKSNRNSMFFELKKI